MAASRVVIVKARGAYLSSGDIDTQKISALFERGLALLTGQPKASDGLASLFKRSDRLGIKVNTIAGRKLSTRPELPLLLARMLGDSVLPAKNIIIWDRTNRELREAGYSLSTSGNGFKIFGTDTEGAGYTQEPIAHLNIGSLFSTIQSDAISASISLAILKDHGLAGVTAGMKNYFGTIHNPNKYHDFNCNPFVAELFDMVEIKGKHRLTILDALTIQYHRGPSYHSRWAERSESLIFSLDPVAADFVGWQIIEKLRSANGLPSLEEEKRKPVYLETAERMGLGKAQAQNIQILEDQV
jgi:uncharacterized protein (DUF362 family)